MKSFHDLGDELSLEMKGVVGICCGHGRREAMRGRV